MGTKQLDSVKNQTDNAFLVSENELGFAHILHSASSMADALAKQGVDRSSPFIAFHM